MLRGESKSCDWTASMSALLIARFARNAGRRGPRLHGPGKSKSPILPKTGRSGAPSGFVLRLRGLGWSASAHALGVEDESFRFGFCSLRLDLFAIPEEADASGVADPDDQLARGMEGRCSGGDQSFLGDQLSVGGDRDPGVFGGAHDQFESGCRFLGGFHARGAEGTNGHVTLLFDLDLILIGAGSCRWGRRRSRSALGGRRIF